MAWWIDVDCHFFERYGKMAKGKKGLARRQACAGDIVISANHAGQWLFETQDEHQQRIRQLARPACLGRAEL